MIKKILILIFVFIHLIPYAYSITEIVVNETGLVNLKPKAEDPDLDKLTYTFSKPLNENGQWQTTYGDAGQYTITVTVSDGEASTSQDILLIVKKKEEPPTIKSYSPTEKTISLDEGASLKFGIEGFDPNNDPLSYEWYLSGKLVSNEKSFTYSPSYEEEGSYQLEVKVSDGTKTITHEWKLTVKNIDRSSLLDEIEPVTVNENDIVKLTLPDFAAYNLRYTISDPIGDDNYWETTYDDSGEHIVTVTITDGTFTASKGIKITVNNIDRAPVFKKIGKVRLRENQKVTITLEAYDPDGDAIKFSALNAPEGSSFDENKFIWQPGYDTVKKLNWFHSLLDKFHLVSKTFYITFIAENNLKTEQLIKIKVMDINRDFTLNIPSITVNEGETITIEPSASDPDGDKISYKFSGWMDKASYKTNYDDAGTYIVTVTASDSEFIKQKDVTITVNDVNRAPIFSPIKSVKVKENSLVELILNAKDPDGDAIIYLIENPPPNSTLTDNIFKWTPGYDVTDDKKEFILTFKASDADLETEQIANITVLNTNRKPTILNATPPNLIVYKNLPILLAVYATDPDGDELTYTWKFSFLEKHKGTNLHQRIFTLSGNKKVTVVISDGKDSISYEWKIKVI